MDDLTKSLNQISALDLSEATIIKVPNQDFYSDVIISGLEQALMLSHKYQTMSGYREALQKMIEGQRRE